MDINDIQQKVLIGVIVAFFTFISRSILEQAVKWVHNQLTYLLFKQNRQDQEAEAFLEEEPDTEEVFIDTSDSHANFLASATNVGMQADLRPLETAAHNPKDGQHVYQLQPHAVQTTPEKMEIPTVQENRPGVLRVRWNRTEADYYELEYDRQTRNSIKVSSTECLLDSMQLHFPSKTFYNIRAIMDSWCNEWPRSAVGLFTSLPEQPQKPLAVHVNSSINVSLIVEKPAKRENLKPVTHFVVEYHTTEDTRWTKHAFPVNELHGISFNGRSAWIVNLKWFVDIASTYHIQISHRNEDGDSLPRECTIKTNKIPPGEPVQPSVAFRNTDTIILKWKKPETNAYTVDHYEVQWEVKEKKMETKTTKKCYAVIRNLKSGTKCLFKVRAVNKESCKGKFTEINAKTSSMTGKIAKVVATGIIGAFFFTIRFNTDHRNHLCKVGR